MTNAEDIKKWLKESGKNRQWLAEKTLTTKGTVNGWLSAGKPIPPAKLALIEKLMAGEEEIHFELPENFEAMLIKMAENAHKSIDAIVMHILEMTIHAQKRLKQKETVCEVTQIEVFPSSIDQSYNLAVIGNIAAGGLQPGDTIPYHIKATRPLGKGEYVLRVEGKSMEPVIQDGALVIMRRHTIPPIPKPGTIVQYDDDRGVTLKKLVRKKNPETGKLEYTLHPLNPAYGDIEPMDGGKISGVYVETLENWSKA